MKINMLDIQYDMVQSENMFCESGFAESYNFVFETCDNVNFGLT